MELNYLAILVAAVAQFVVGAFWYMPLFGNLWCKIHGIDPNSIDQKAAMRQMAPLYGLQFIGTLITTVVLALFIMGMPMEWNVFGIAGFVWLGFIFPTQLSAVMFGGTPPQWLVKKTAIMAGGALACLMAAALVFHWML